MSTTMALELPAVYAPPAVAYHGETAEREEAVWWVVFVGFAYAVALAWATWCRRNGGSAEISLGWSGFKVACKG